MESGREGVVGLPSIGKSSNSSSSSRAAAFCWSFSVGPEVSSEVTALVVEVEPSAAADMVWVADCLVWWVLSVE